MNNRPPARRAPTRVAVPFVSFLLFLSAHGSASAFDCTQIYNAGGWVIEACPEDPSVSTKMEVRALGQLRGLAARVSVYHKSQNSPGTPQVLVIYSSGFVRLKQNEDPPTPIPFGSSFVLGPAFWTSPSNYFHNPRLARLDIDAALLPDGALRMRAEGTNDRFDVSYDLVLPPPLDRETRLHVAQTYTATADVQIDPTRRAESQGFKLVQVSSMFLNKGGTCDFGNTDCHDSDAARYVAAGGQTREVAFASLTPSAFIFNQPAPLGGRFLDVLHTDDQGWQGNTPNVRVELDALPQGHTVTPQGFVAATTDPNHDNVGAWLHDDGAASQSWAAGQSGSVGYWLIAQDDPPEARSEPTVQFGVEAQAVEENAGGAVVNVTRAGDVSGATTVEYATVDGTASERSDYTRAAGTLRFAPGEVSKSFKLFVTHDAFAEGAETVNLLLSNPTGAAYGHPAAAVLTINNVASTLTGNPIDSSQFFVRQHYADFLNREADASGLAFWTNEIEQCGAEAQCREVKRINVSAAFFLSIEFQQTGYLVYLFHQAAFSKGPSLRLQDFLRDTQELGRDVVVLAPGWEQRLEANKQAYADAFVLRPEFVAAYPQTLTPAQFVDALNANTRDPQQPMSGGSLSQAERDRLVADLEAARKTRAQVLRAVAEDADFSRREFTRAFVLMQYFGYLRRNPDEAGYNFWLGKLNQFNGDFVRAEMVKAFISSLEYRGRFGAQ